MKTREEMIKHYNLQFFMNYKGIKVYKGIIEGEERYAWFRYNSYYEQDLITTYSLRYELKWIKHQLTSELKIGNLTPEE